MKKNFENLLSNFFNSLLIFNMIATGLDSCRQLFIDTKDTNSEKILCVNKFTNIPIDPKKLKDFSSGLDFSAYVTVDGEAFVIGDDREFSLGTSKRQIYENPTKVQFDLIDKNDKFVSVHCGNFYTVYLTESGAIIYASFNSDTSKPALHRLDSKAVFISGGMLKPIALDENGDIYLFDTDPEQKPTKYHLDEPVYDVCGCDNVFTDGFVVAVTVSGKVYSNGSFSEETNEFRLVEEFCETKIQRVFGIHRHCLAISDSNQVFVMGSNVTHQHGNGRTDSTNRFSRIHYFESNKIVCAGAGYSHSAFVTDQGELFVCGSSEFGQLGLSSYETAIVVTNVKLPSDKKVKYVWTGSYSTFALINAEPPQHRGIELILKKFKK